MQYACFFCQHCIEGRMTFAPIFYGLDCGAYPEKPKGSWHNHGYQMIGMFKKDWERIGGKLTNKKKVVFSQNVLADSLSLSGSRNINY